MRKRAIKIGICLILTLLLATGCWDSTDVEDRDICTAIVVDKHEDQFAFYVEVAGITGKTSGEKSEESGQQHNTIVVKGSGKTYAEARMNLDNELYKPIYLGAVQSLIITERLADEGISEYTLRLRQLTEYRKTMDVIVTPDEPEELLKTQPANESTVGLAIENELDTLKDLGTTYHLSLAELLQKLQSKNPCYLMNTLSVREKQIAMIGSTVFHGSKRVGFIPIEESRGIVYLAARRQHKIQFDYMINSDGKTFTLETTLKKRIIKASYDGEKPVFDVDMRFEAMGLYPSERMTITDEVRTQSAAVLKEKLESEIRKAIETSQKEYKCDYLSFSEPFRISNPEVFEAIDWCAAFEKAQFNLNISVKVIPNRNVDYNPESIL